MGTTIYRAQTGAFEAKRGPVFAHFVLADEINRAPAKVQSALLDAAGWYIAAGNTRAPDADLQQRIDTEIRRSPFIPPDEVHVQVKNGKATLTGTVASAKERNTAGNEAFQAGATAVDNELKVD